MRALFYSEEEAQALIFMPKRMEVEAWENQTHGRSEDFTVCVMDVRPEHDDDGRIEFKVEMRTNEVTDGLNITLKGRMDKRPWEGFTRYDIHDGLHDNPKWFPPQVIDPYVFHRHVYRERSFAEEERWDKCALPLDLSNVGSPDNLKSRLLRRFLADLSIKFADSGTYLRLFPPDAGQR